MKRLNVRDRKVRILLVSRNLPPMAGGMERLMQGVVDGLAGDDGLEVDVIGPSGFSVNKARRLAASPFFYPAFLLHSSSVVRRVYRQRYDIVVGGSLLMAPLALWAARRAKCPLLLFAHGSDVVHPSWLYQAMMPLFAKPAEMIVANSRYIADQLFRRGFAKERIGIISPGLESGMFESRDGGLLRERLGLGRKPILLGVGRLLSSKGFGHFVRDIFPSVLESFPEAHFVLIGDAPPGGKRDEMSRIRAAAEFAGVGRQVHCLGSMEMGSESLLEAYAAADVHVFPALSPQGFGLVALEAAAQGTPTVAYAQGGICDAVVEGHSGVLVPPGEARQFSRAVCAALESPPSPSAVNAAVQFRTSGHYLDEVKSKLKSLVVSSAG